MRTYQIDKLNLEDLDVDALEQRLELSLSMHPLCYPCGTFSGGCKTEL